MINSHWVEDWLAARAESDKTKDLYERHLQIFADYAARNSGQDPGRIVQDWRAANRLGVRDREEFLIDWSDIVRSFNTYIKKRYAPLTVKNFLTVLRSFLKFWDIPIRIDLPKRACVIYHNKDLSREELRQILTFASPRDRVMWLVMAESGMRAGTAVNMKYWQIKEDFEAERIPIRILLPSSSLKDHVGDRWSFIGDDGFRELKEYLVPRLPLDDEDYVFASEKQGKVKGEQFSVSSLSVKFSRVVSKLDLTESRAGKPKSIRMHGLRKYFRNNMRADSAFMTFWMGHSLGVDAHYITRDPERHRKEYKKGYEFLRIFEPSLFSVAEQTQRITQLEKKLEIRDHEIEELRETVKQLQEVTPDVKAWLRDMGQQLDEKMDLIDKKLEKLRRLEK